MGKYLYILLVIATCLCPFHQTFASDSKKHLTLNSHKTTETERKSNIKEPIPTTDTWLDKARNSDCCVTFVNHTGYIIDVYCEGIYEGSIGAYSQAFLCKDMSRGVYLETSGKTRSWTYSNSCCDTAVMDLYL